MEAFVKRTIVILVLVWLVLSLITTVVISLVFPTIGATLEANGVEIPAIVNGLYIAVATLSCLISGLSWGITIGAVAIFIYVLRTLLTE